MQGRDFAKEPENDPGMVFCEDQQKLTTYI